MLYNVDAFGQPIQFTIKGGNGVEQTSKLGGIVTILIYCFTLVYMGIKIDKMLLGNLDIITQEEKMTDYRTVQKVYLKDLNPFITMFELNTEESILPYLTIKLYQTDHSNGKN